MAKHTSRLSLLITSSPQQTTITRDHRSSWTDNKRLAHYLLALTLFSRVGVLNDKVISIVNRDIFARSSLVFVCLFQGLNNNMRARTRRRRRRTGKTARREFSCQSSSLSLSLGLKNKVKTRGTTHAYVRTGKHNCRRRQEQQQQQAARRRRMFLKVFSSISKRIVSNAFVHAKQKHPTLPSARRKNNDDDDDDRTENNKRKRESEGERKTKKKMTCRLERQKQENLLFWPGSRHLAHFH